MRTGSLIFLLIWECLCVSISSGKPSIYFLLNIGYVVYVVYVVYVAKPNLTCCKEGHHPGTAVVVRASSCVHTWCLPH